MSLKRIAAIAATAAIVTTGSLAGASAQAAPLTAGGPSAPAAAAPANGRYLVYAVGYYQPSGGVFTPFQQIGSGDSGVRVVGEYGVAGLERDPSVRPGTFQTGDDLEPGKFAVALLDPESGLPLRMARIDYPGQTIQLWP